MSGTLSSAFDLNLSRVQMATDCMEELKNIKEENQVSYVAIVSEFISRQQEFIIVSL